MRKLPQRLHLQLLFTDLSATVTDLRKTCCKAWQYMIVHILAVINTLLRTKKQNIMHYYEKEYSNYAPHKD
jgi:hypothetical protein